MSNHCNQLPHVNTKTWGIGFLQLVDLGILVVSNNPSEDGPWGPKHVKDLEISNNNNNNKKIGHTGRSIYFILIFME
jgi:hypothetical protein